MAQRIGYMGLGIMGLSMAKNLLKAGHEVYVWNRSREKTFEATEAGGFALESPKAIREKCDVVLMCVTNENAVREVLFEGEEAFIKGEGPSCTLVNM